MKIIPKAGAEEIVFTLINAGFSAYLVGGCVRDCLLGILPGEWDITTSARPEQVTKLFKKVAPTGIEYGTVTVLLPDGTYEVTTFRKDEHYIDGRHPSNVVFSDNIRQDLSRRDFTVNAMAYDLKTNQLIDDYQGRADLKNKIIRSVGRPLERFLEDGLRPLRACRLAAKLEFKIEKETLEAIPMALPVFNKVAPERIHDELVKLLSAKKPSIGFELMRKAGLLKTVIPELEKCRGVEQPPEFHPHDVYWHSLFSCDSAPQNNYIVRLAALLHDIGKPDCKADMTFYNHDQVGARMAEALLRRLKFSNDDIEKICSLIRNHMFDYSSDWGDAAVRRFIRRIGGIHNVADVFEVRKADTLAMKAREEFGYLDDLQRRIDKVIADENALHIKDLKIDGKDVMSALNILPGPKVGKILNSLLEEVLDDPSLNSRETLLKLISGK